MKKTIRIVLEVDVLSRAKRQAAAEGHSMSDLIEAAVDRYLAPGAPPASQREAAYDLFCGQPMRLTPEQYCKLLRADTWAP